MNRINQLLENKKQNILSVYFTAGYLELKIPKNYFELEKSRCWIIGIRIPFSDPWRWSRIQEAVKRLWARGFLTNFWTLKGFSAQSEFSLDLKGTKTGKHLGWELWEKAGNLVNRHFSRFLFFEIRF